MRPRIVILVLFVNQLQPVAGASGAGMEVAKTLQINRGLLERSPMYTCLETISRSEQTPKQRRPHVLDVVQVDVGVVGNQEIYSWPGEKVFSSEDIGKLVGHGFLGTGFLSTFSKNVFLGNAAIVKPADEGKVSGTARRFTYSIPSLMNHWIVDWLGAKATVGESGEFWVDENTRLLLRLRVNARDIPPELPLKEVTASISYQILQLKNRPVLLPSDAELVAVEWNETSHTDLIGYSECHVFQAESQVSNSMEALVQMIERREVTRDSLPGGLTISLKLDNEIRLGTTKVGDPVLARIVKAVRHGDSAIPQGALVKGRIREFQPLPDLPYMEVGIEFNEIETPGHVSTFLAQPLNMPSTVKTVLTKDTTRTLSSPGLLASESNTRMIRPLEIPGTATFFIANSQLITKGFQMTLRTQKQRHR